MGLFDEAYNNGLGFAQDRQYWRDVKNNAVAAAEYAAMVGSGYAGEVVGGLGGLLAAPHVGADGAADVVGNIQDAMTYQPRTEAAQAGLSAVAPYATQAGEWINEQAADLEAATGIPREALVAAPQMIGESLPMAGLFAKSLSRLDGVDSVPSKMGQSGAIVNGADGKPLTLYHGTSGNAKRRLHDQITWLTDDPEYAAGYAGQDGRVLKFNVDAQNPELGWYDGDVRSLPSGTDYSGTNTYKYAKGRGVDFVGGDDGVYASLDPSVLKPVNDFDPRFDNRILEQGRLNNLQAGVDWNHPEVNNISIADLEGKPFITSMSDRTAAGGVLNDINGNPLHTPVELLGGQDYMFNNPGQVWASGANPTKQIYELAHDTKRLTGQDPIYMPWRMAPTGGDFAHMTGETMLSYAAGNLTKRNIGKVNTQIKKLIPEWSGVGDEMSIAQYRAAPDKVRKNIKQILDRDFRNEGGLSIGEARLSVADPKQLTGQDGGLMNVGQITPDHPIITESGHPSYPYGVPGEGVGRLQEDLNVFQLMPDVASGRNIPDVMQPRATDLRALQMKPYAGIITEDILRGIF